MFKVCLIIKKAAVVCMFFLRYSAIGISYPEILRKRALGITEVHLGHLTFRIEKGQETSSSAPTLYPNILLSLVYSISQMATVCISKGKGKDFQSKTSQLASLTHEFDCGKSREGVR